MSLRVDSTSLIPGALVCGNRGLGVIGSLIPATGDSGAGYIYNDLSLPADNDKEFIGRITTLPTDGEFYAYEDSSFTFTGAADGAYTAEYQLYVDGVLTGAVQTIALQVGSPSAAYSVALADAVFSGGASAVASPEGGYSITLADALFSGGATGSALFTQEQLDFLLAYMEANLMIWNEPIEGGKTAAEMLRIIASALAGTSTKAGNTITFKGIDGTTDRITGSYDAEGNRTGAILDGS